MILAHKFIPRNSNRSDMRPTNIAIIELLTISLQNLLAFCSAEKFFHAFVVVVVRNVRDFENQENKIKIQYTKCLAHRIEKVSNFDITCNM